MANGETTPPGPTEPTQPDAGAPGGKKCKPETRRKTDILRVYSDDKGKPPEKKPASEAPKGSGAEQPRGPGTPIESPPSGFGTPQPGGGGGDSAPSGGSGGGTGDQQTPPPAPAAPPPRPKCSKEGKFWVDLEVMRNATFKGVQWRGPAVGNQPQETIWKPSTDYTGHQGNDITPIKVKKDKDKEGKDKEEEKKKDKDDVDLRNKRCSKMATAGANIERSFKNEGDVKGDRDKGNSCRKNNSHKKRVRFNPIEKDHLKEDEKTGKRDQPPRNPKKYKDAVKKSMAQQAAQQGPPLWLLVEIEKKDKERRAKQLRRQEISRAIYPNGNIDLPGSEKSKGDDLKEPHIRLDPYQKIVNFGPDGLAAEFEGTAKAGGGNGGGGGDLGGALGDIGKAITGGAQPAG